MKFNILLIIELIPKKFMLELLKELLKILVCFTLLAVTIKLTDIILKR
jgi:hypothetical protein